MAKIRYLVDEHVSRVILRGLQRRGIDAVRPQDIQREGFSDEAQLEWAAQEARVVVTFDQDYLRLAAQRSEHAGVAYCFPDKYGISELLGLLILMYEVVDSLEMQNRVEYL